MDLKALMQKLETINTKQVVTESVETKKVITESVARRVVKESADPVFTSSIARGLVEEFGYELEEAEVANPYQGADAAKFAAMSPEDQAWLTKGGGKPDINDQFILARAPNKGAPAATAPGAGTKPTAPAVAPGGVQAQGDDDGNTMITKPDGTVQVVGPDGKPLANGGRVDPAGAATKPAAVDPAVAATREKFKALMDKLEKTGGVSGSAPAPAAPANPATGAGTKPAAAGFANTGGGAAVGNPNMAKQGVAKESVSFEDDQTLLAIKNIRY
jgi:hypothetical protein